MNGKVSELLDLTKKLLDLSMEIVDDSLPLIEPVPAKEVRYSIFLRVQMSESLKFGYGAYYSCSHGWGHGGIGAARSIYEILLDIKYINQDKARMDERFTRFLDHGNEYLYREMEKIRESGKVVSQKKQDKYTDKYNQLKEKYKNMHEQDVKSGIAKSDATPKHRPYNWAGLDLTKKVKEINLEHFHQLSKNLANLSHVSIRATLDAIADSTDNQFEVDLSLHPGSIYCFDVLTVTFTCIVGMLQEYIGYFKIDDSRYPDLEDHLEDYKALLNR